jgi:hypothetical protein
MCLVEAFVVCMAAAARLFDVFCLPGVLLGDAAMALIEETNIEW